MILGICEQMYQKSILQSNVLHGVMHEKLLHMRLLMITLLHMYGSASAGAFLACAHTTGQGSSDSFPDEEC